MRLFQACLASRPAEEDPRNLSKAIAISFPTNSIVQVRMSAILNYHHLVNIQQDYIAERARNHNGLVYGGFVRD